MEELAAQHAVKYRKAYEQAQQAMGSLQSVTPWPMGGTVGECDPKRVAEHWRRRYASVVEVIPTSESALREATYRETNGLLPCKMVEKGKDRYEKRGARDAAIWLSAVEYARDNENESVFFVSSNPRDFGDGTSYEPPMDSDVQGLGDRFVHLTNLDDVVSRFARPVETDRELIQDALDSPATSATIKRAVANALALESNTRWGRTVFAGSQVRRPGQKLDVTFVTFFYPTWAKLGSIQAVDSYRIGDHEWCTATARWLLTGFALAETNRDRAEYVACAWETRVLFTPNPDEPRLTLLRSFGLPGPVDEIEIALVPSPGQLDDKELVRRLSADFLRIPRT